MERGQVDFYARTATDPAIRTVCEVGFNAGYSTAVWLSANPLSKVISFDLIMLGHYGPSCAEALQKKFPGRLKVQPLAIPCTCSPAMGAVLDRLRCMEAVQHYD